VTIDVLAISIGQGQISILVRIELRVRPYCSLKACRIPLEWRNGWRNPAVAVWIN
jgi:hypothetical protein